MTFGQLNPAFVLDAALEADRLGYESAWLPEHLVFPLEELNCRSNTVRIQAIVGIERNDVLTRRTSDTIVARFSQARILLDEDRVPRPIQSVNDRSGQGIGRTVIHDHDLDTAFGRVPAAA